MHRQLVLGIGNSKCKGAKLRDSGADYKVATRSPRAANWTESLSATDGCDWSTEVSDVQRCQSMQRFVHQQTGREANGGGLTAHA